MKYFLRVFLVLVLVVAVVTGAYYYMNGNNPLEKKDEKVSLTTVTKPPATEKVDNRVLLVTLKKEGFKLFKDGSTIILEHKGKEFEFDNWSSMIDKEKPELYYADFDDDGEKELLVKAVCGIHEKTGEYEYELYLLNPIKDKNGKESYSVSAATRSTWSAILDQYIREELSQLKNCDKIVQFSMNKISESINYDKKTGIATNGHSGYIRAIQNSKGQYLKVDTWAKGEGVYTVTKYNKIVVDISIIIKYVDVTEYQEAGVIHFMLDVDENGKYTPANNSLEFITNKKYRVAAPTLDSIPDWRYTENNADKSVDTGESVIDWIQYPSGYAQNINTQTIDFKGVNTDINSVAKIVVTSNQAMLYAKPGFTFDPEAVKNNDMSVVINSGSDTECDIAYKSSLVSKDGAEILVISFDRAYAKSEINKLNFNFGAK